MTSPLVNIKRKLSNTLGETIAETLIALLIIAAMVAALATAIVTSQNINKQARDDASGNEFTYKVDFSGDGTVTLAPEGGTSGTVDVTITKSDNGYYYYTAK